MPSVVAMKRKKNPIATGLRWVRALVAAWTSIEVGGRGSGVEVLQSRGQSQNQDRLWTRALAAGKPRPLDPRPLDLRVVPPVRPPHVIPREEPRDDDDEGAEEDTEAQAPPDEGAHER